MNFERRVTVSYASAFALVLAVFALAVHVAFAFDVQRDLDARLAALLALGRNAVEVHDGRPKIDADGVQLVDPRLEGVAWYDAAGTPLVTLGLSAGTGGQSSTLDTRSSTLPPPQPGAARVPVLVRATVSRAAAGRLLARLDLGLLIGFGVALTAAGVGGRYLAKRSLVRVGATIRTLRDFTADAAHELRGPLAALESNAAASLRDAHDLPPQHLRRLETMARTATQMTRTLEDLLLLARAETPIERELFAIDLGPRIEAVVDARRALASEKGLALAFAPFRARMYGNPVEIDRIAGNLLDNAIRYTAPGGSVEVAGFPDRGGIALRVRDTGIGIAATDLPRIFERFWRADTVRSHTSGTGLGLAIVRALARRHGGEVSAHSTRAGSEFTVWFPLRPPRAEAPAAVTQPR